MHAFANADADAAAAVVDDTYLVIFVMCRIYLHYIYHVCCIFNDSSLILFQPGSGLTPTALLVLVAYGCKTSA